MKLTPRTWRPCSRLKTRAARLLLLVFAPFALSCPQASSAATELRPASQITALSVSAANPVEGRFELDFNGFPPSYSLTDNDTTVVRLELEGVAPGPGVSVQALPHGLVRSVDFSKRNDVLTLAIRGNEALHVEAKLVGAQKIALSIVRYAQRQGGMESDAETAKLPAHTLSPAQADAFEVVPLKYADISEVVGILTSDKSIKPNDSFIPQEPAFGSVGSNGPYGNNNNFNSNLANNLNGQNDSSLGRAIDDVMSVDRRLNAIVLHGAPEVIARLKSKIAELDRPVESVILETVFVELSESGAHNLGFDLNNTSGQIVTGVYESGPYVTNGGGGTNAAVKGISLQASLAAQIQKGEGRVISKPRISAQSGSTAKIITGDALPILTSITLSGVNGVSQQVQYVNVGVTLQIAPRVTDDGFVTSHVFCVVSSVTGQSQGYPKISQREALTTATVRDGESFVIGGLSEETKISSDSKIPLIGDIPLIGNLSHSKIGSSTKTDLYIVVTPHIVRAPQSGRVLRPG